MNSSAVVRVAVRENPEAQGQHGKEVQEEPLQGKFSYSRAGADTAQAPVQRVRLAGEDTLQTNATISDHDHGHDHDRGSVHQWAKAEAFDLGPFRETEEGAVCNHHWRYAGIQTDFLNNKVINETVSEAARKTLITYSSLDLLNVMMSTHRNIMIRARDQATVPRNAFDAALDYCIMKICDYPGNLFYWPAKTNTEPDNPRYAYNDDDIPDGWDFSNYVTADEEDEVLDDERERVKAGREELETAVA